MKPLLLLTTLIGVQFASAGEADFELDRKAILSMAGNFAVNFQFKETVSLTAGYEFHEPYEENAHEHVELVEDTGKTITLQHLLVINEGGPKPVIIKHWAQIWKYEDPIVLDFQGDRTWKPVHLSADEVKGTWTQYVTSVDDSPRYKAAGKWVHEGNYSAWTSMPSTRPLPRREYSKRKDYDLIAAVNHHIITPDGWVHTQENRKVVHRDGRDESLCLEIGKNTYRRVTDDEVDFQAAIQFWNEQKDFWAKVRHAWVGIIDNAPGPIHCEQWVDQKRLREVIAELQEEADVPTEKVAKAIGSFVKTGE